MEEYQDIKQKVRPFKKRHSHEVIRQRGLRITTVRNNEHPVKVRAGTDITCIGTSKQSSRSIGYASTKGCSIKTKSKSYELR